MSEGGRSRSATLGDRYASHNQQRGRGFIFGGQERVGALREALGPVRGNVLDLGCRDGSLARALEIAGPTTVGVDIDADALRVVADEGIEQPCRTDLWGPLPFRDAAFDAVVGGEIVEHAPFPDELVGEVARVLRPGGAFVGSVPNAFRLNRLMFLTGRWFEADPTHLRHFSPTTLRALLTPPFQAVTIRPCVGRWAGLWPRMLGNDLVWRATR